MLNDDDNEQPLQPDPLQAQIEAGYYSEETEGDEYKKKLEAQEHEWKEHEDKKAYKPGVDDADYKRSQGTDEYVFYGYPSGNYLKQVSYHLNRKNSQQN